MLSNAFMTCLIYKYVVTQELNTYWKISAKEKDWFKCVKKLMHKSIIEFLKITFKHIVNQVV